MSALKKGIKYRAFYANSLDPLIPEHWAYESIAILEEEMVMGNLVHRDFNPIVASYGETIHTRKPSEFRAVRKTNADNVTVQDVSATDVEVKLDQWIHVSFTIKDGEQTKAFKDLVGFYLEPAMMANARLLDQALASQAVQFLSNTRGGFGLLSGSTAKDYLIDMDDLMNQNKAYGVGRNLVLTSPSKASILKADIFHQADKRGDGGRALREAELGRAFGFNTYLDLNTPRAVGGSKNATTTTTAAAAKGATTVSLTATVLQGTYFTIAGDMTPLRCQSVSGAGPFVVTLTRPLPNAVGSGAVVQAYTTALVNFAAGYSAGYAKEITFDGSGVPNVGQIISFNNTGGSAIRTPEYVIVQKPSSTTIVLDRPLETALADNDVICLGPDGDLNFAFHRNALTLVNRPLAAPLPGAGARAAVAVHNNMAMRVVITYDGNAQGHLVTLDGLFGVKVLDTALGAVLLG